MALALTFDLAGDGGGEGAMSDRRALCEIVGAAALDADLVQRDAATRRLLA
jgi:hypothetical protein